MRFLILHGFRALRRLFSVVDFQFSKSDVDDALQFVREDTDRDPAKKKSQHRQNAVRMRSILERWNEDKRKEENERRSVGEVEPIPMLNEIGCITTEMLDTWERLYRKHFVDTQLEDKMGLDTKEWHQAMDGYVADVVDDLVLRAAKFDDPKDMAGSCMVAAPAKAIVLLSNWMDDSLRELPLLCDSMIRNLARTWNKYPGAIQEVRRIIY